MQPGKIESAKELLSSLEDTKITYPVCDLNDSTQGAAIMQQFYTQLGINEPSLIIQRAIQSVLGREIDFKKFQPNELINDPVISIVIEEYGERGRLAFDQEMTTIFEHFCDKVRGKSKGDTPDEETDVRVDAYSLFVGEK